LAFFSLLIFAFSLLFGFAVFGETRPMFVSPSNAMKTAAAEIQKKNQKMKKLLVEIQESF
jgi:hypothetical protein